jgi:hypothetical protein
MEPNDEAGPDLQRRRFLIAARGAGALGALAALAGRGAPAQAATAPPAPQAPVSRGYHLTEHIQKYYRTARYW